MMVNCELCGTELADDSPAVIAMKLDKNAQWYVLENKSTGNVVNITNVGQFIIEDIKVKPTLEDLSDTGYGYYGEDEYPQGTQYQTYIVLKYGDTFFKKTGEADSYGEVTWTGIVKPTKPKIISVTAWE
jgi:hypothetical protein